MLDRLKQTLRNLGAGVAPGAAPEGANETEAGPTAATAESEPRLASGASGALGKLSLAELREIVTDAKELNKGSEIFDKGQIAHLARYERKLFCEAAGSGASPYRVSLAFGDTITQVRARCSCMASRSRPYCKHAAALLVAWSRAPESFVVGEAPPPGGEAPLGGKAARVKKGKTDASALMRAGVEQIVTLTRELGCTGAASIGAERVESLGELGHRLRESRLRRLSARTLELAQLLASATPREPEPDPRRILGQSSAHGARTLDSRRYTDLVADLLVTARKLEKHLTANEAIDPRHVEELIGKTWSKKDRAPVEGLRLLEYAFLTARTADDFVIRESRFVDLASGTHYSEKQILPAFLAKRTPPKPSFAGQVLDGAGGGVYPGYAPHRLDLESKGERRPSDGAAFALLAERALPGIEAALKSYQEHRKDLFAPDGMPVCVRASGLLAEGRRSQLLDDAGAALHVRAEPVLEERLADALEGGALHAVLGEMVLDVAVPTLVPHAVVIEGVRGLELRTLSRRASGGDPRPAGMDTAAAEPGAWLEIAREAGLSPAAVSLGEIREELARLFVVGLAALTPRSTDALVRRLRDLGLDKPAGLLADTAAKPEPGERLEGFVKVYQVLEVALVRLAGAVHLDRGELVSMATCPAVFIRAPETYLSPEQVCAARRGGRLSRYEVAVHYGRHYQGLPAEALLDVIEGGWGDGRARPHLVASIAERARASAHDAALRALHPLMPLGAQRTAIEVLAMLGEPRSWKALAELVSETKEPVVAAYARRALRGGGAGAPNDEALALRETVRDGSAWADRVKAIGALVDRHDLDAIPDLQAAYFTDPSSKVRDRAAIGLGELGDADLVDELVDRLTRRGSYYSDEQARVACRMLERVGDTRATSELIAAYVDGFRPVQVAEGLAGLRVAALGPLVAAAEQHPEIAKRKSTGEILKALHPHTVASYLETKMRLLAEEPEVVARAKLLMRLAAYDAAVRARVAEALGEVAASASAPIEKKLRKLLTTNEGGGAPVAARPC